MISISKKKFKNKFQKKIINFRKKTKKSLKHNFIPTCFSAKNFNFNFNTFHFFDGLLFVVVGIFFPIILNILITYKLIVINNINRNLSLIMIDFSFAIFLICYFLFKYKWYFINQKGLIFYSIILFLPCVTQLLNILFLGLFFKSFAIIFTKKIIVQDPFWLNVIALISQFICEAIAIFLIFAYDKKLWLKVKYFFKDGFYCFLVLGFLIAANILNVIFNGLKNLTFFSANQNGLNQFYKTFLTTLIFGFMTIILAPLFEELTTRHGIYLLSSNKFLGFLASSIYFAGMHVASFGDWENIISYLGASITLSLVFIIMNGNVMYCITTHSLLNVVAFTFGVINFNS